MNCEAGLRLGMRGDRCRSARIHHQIDHRQQMAMLPEVFANPALDAVARHCTAGRADTDRKTEPWVLETVQFRAHEKERVGRSQARAMDGIELRLRE